MDDNTLINLVRMKFGATPIPANQAGHQHEKKGGPCSGCRNQQMLNYFNSLKSKLMYLNEGDRVLTNEGTGDIVFTGYGCAVQLDRGDYLPLTDVIARLK